MRHDAAVVGGAVKHASPSLPRADSVSARLTALMRDPYFWLVFVMALAAALFCYAPQSASLLQLSPEAARVLNNVATPAYRLLFAVSAAGAAWRFGIRGGLVICAVVGPVLLLRVLDRAADPSAWIDVGLIALGVLFSAITGSQGQMQKTLRETTARLGKEIAERKQSEEALLLKTALLEAQSETTIDGLIAVDNNRQMLLYNRQLQEMWRIPPGILTSKLYHLVHRHMINMHKDAEEAEKRFEHFFAHPEEKASYEVSMADGRVLDAFSAPLLDASGVMRGRIWYFRDITARREMEHRMMMTDRLASIGELVSGVAHEINNPLASVIGFSQLALEKDLANDVKEDLTTIRSEAQRAARIVKDLLTFARKHGPVKQPTHVNAAIEDVLRLRAHDHQMAKIEVVRRFADDLPEIMADYHQLQQVFFNVVINAEQAMAEAHGRGRLMISTEKVDRIIKVTFTDDGPGIPEQNMARLFEPFFTTKPPGKGTGLGLSICHRIITEHGGRIYARSQPGEGARFIVELPLDANLN